MHQFHRDFCNTSSKSDKISQHGYHRIYPWFLAHLRNEAISLLEIGLNQNNSITLWKEYFKDVSIYGIDISPKENVINAKIFKVDQSKQQELDNFVKTVNKQFDVIIDDGSHVPDHQLKTINTFWQLLKPGGVYIIEDVETSYWGNSSCYDYKFNANRKRSNLLYQFASCIQWVNKEFVKKIRRQNNLVVSEQVFHETEIISFAYNSIILIKKDPDFAEYYDRLYRYEYRINEDNFLRKLFKRN
jgi:SAM-dependent methyltransferase